MVTPSAMLISVVAWQPALRVASGPRLRATTPTLNFMQAKQIETGATLPSLDGMEVEIVTDDCAFDDTCEIISDEPNLLTKGKTILVGMPGAFTPTCTDAHLPGYIRGAKKLRRNGVNNIAIVTTNDRFIMTAWKRKMRECASQEGLRTIDTEVSMLADKNGNLIKSLGLAYAESLDRKEKNAFIQ